MFSDVTQRTDTVCSLYITSLAVDHRVRYCDIYGTTIQSCFVFVFFKAKV